MNESLIRWLKYRIKLINYNLKRKNSGCSDVLLFWCSDVLLCMKLEWKCDATHATCYLNKGCFYAILCSILFI